MSTASPDMCWLVGDPDTARFTAADRYPDVTMIGRPNRSRSGSSSTATNRCIGPAPWPINELRRRGRASRVIGTVEVLAMSHGRKIRDADEALRALDAIARSGADRVAWARANNIDARSLNAWRVNLSRGRSASPLRLVELVAGEPTDARAGARTACTIRFGGFAVDVDSGVDDGLLVRVLRAVRAC
jgi:hypothetical protein